MTNSGPNLETILDLLAERLAEKLAPRVGGGSAATDPRLLDVEAAATYLGRSKTSIQHMIAAGALPVVRSDRRVFLDRQDLYQWIESNKQAPL